MDGTRDRPPGKSAENQGRRDGIRAGAVSGPWRSAPRQPGDGASPGPAAAPSPPAAPAPRPNPAPVAAEMREVQASERARARGAVATRAWLVFGLAAAVVIILVAVALRPDSYLPVPEGSTSSVAGVPLPPEVLEDGIAPATEATAVPVRVPPPNDGGPIGGDATPATGTAPADTTAAPPPGEPATAAAGAGATEPALAGVTSVRLRIGPDFPAARREAIVAALEATGVPAILVEPLPFAIATSRVGYYRAADLGAAEALGALMSPVIDQGATLGVRDYGQLLSDAEPGRLDLWVGN